MIGTMEVSLVRRISPEEPTLNLLVNIVMVTLAIGL